MFPPERSHGIIHACWSLINNFYNIKTLFKPLLIKWASITGRIIFSTNDYGLWSKHARMHPIRNYTELILLIKFQ